MASKWVIANCNQSQLRSIKNYTCSIACVSQLFAQSCFLLNILLNACRILEKKVHQCLKIVFTIHVCTSTNNHITKLNIIYLFSHVRNSQSNTMYMCINCNLSIVIWGRMFNSLKLKYTVWNSKKNKTKQTKEHMKCSYMYVYTRMIFAAVLSPAIKIFHRHLGPNLYIFAVKFSPWF